MKIIIPMAGMGKRLRPHTLAIPKPLIPIAGKPIVYRIVEDIVKVCNNSIDEIAYVVGDFGKEVEQQLVSIAQKFDAKGTIYYQDVPLGTAHAINCASKSLSGNVVIAFADTLFKADFILDTKKDGIIWVNKVANPSSFGVVKISTDNIITDFVEKPVTFVSDLAIIGIYYIKDGDFLKKEIQYLIDNNIKEKGEYQLTNALENMKQKGYKFAPGQITEWLDCGNKDNTVYTNQRILELNKSSQLISNSAKTKNSVIIPPCFLGDNVIIENSVIGPHVSVENNSVIKNCIISNSIIQSNTKIANSNFTNSMLGNYVEFNGELMQYSLGDYSTQVGC